MGALAWRQFILTSSCNDGKIHNHDVRSRDHHVGSFLHHTQCVPGLEWSPDENYLASGSNDNLALIWDARKINSHDSKPLHELDSHNGCVKALAWNPRARNMLATGGGTVDRTIKFWNAVSGNETNSIDTNSQVCSIIFSTEYDEFISCHGYQLNQLTIWQYPSCKKVVDLCGHEERVLHMTQSPDGAVICSGSEDETLRFWRVFAPDDSVKAKSSKAKAQPNKLTSMP